MFGAAFQTKDWELSLFMENGIWMAKKMVKIYQKALISSTEKWFQSKIQDLQKKKRLKTSK